jgi:hypothetical protein
MSERLANGKHAGPPNIDESGLRNNHHCSWSWAVLTSWPMELMNCSSCAVLSIFIRSSWRITYRNTRTATIENKASSYHLQEQATNGISAPHNRSQQLRCNYGIRSAITTANTTATMAHQHGESDLEERDLPLQHEDIPHAACGLDRQSVGKQAHQPADDERQR